jgi:hypothetical protein
MAIAFRTRADTGGRGAQISVPTALNTTTANENLLHAVPAGTDLDQLSLDFFDLPISRRGALFGCEDRFVLRDNKKPVPSDNSIGGIDLPSPFPRQRPRLITPQSATGDVLTAWVLMRLLPGEGCFTDPFRWSM